MRDEPTATLDVALLSILSQLPASSAEAKALGVKFYFNGKPCINGHLCERWATTRHCMKCNRDVVQRWRDQHQDVHRENSRRWRKENPELKRQQHRKWYERNKERAVWHADNRRAKIYGSSGTHSASEVRKLLATQRFRCAETTCRTVIKTKYHKDHIMPLSLGGSNDIHNIQLLCQPCNSRKYNKHPVIWAQENGRLL